MKRNKIVFSVNRLNVFLFCFTFIIKFFTDSLLVARGSGGFLVTSKYLTMILGIVISLYIVEKKKQAGETIIFHRQLIDILEVVLLFAGISLVEILIHMEMTSKTLVELAYILLSILYAFGLLNAFSFHTILKCMKILLVFAIGGYVIEVGTGIFTIHNILLSNYYDSYSPFESSYSASISMTLCTFFAYYRKEKKWTIISFVFCLATFKRLNILFAILFLFYPLLFNPNSKISNHVKNIFKVAFILATVLFYYFYQPSGEAVFERIFRDTTTHFSMGRNQLLMRLILGGYKSYGYGSTTDFLGRGLEIDFIKIMMEVTLLGLTFFIWKYYDLVKQNAFCFVMMTENMINFLTSHSLSSAFNWALRFVLIGCILYKCKAVYSGPLFIKKVEYELIS